MNINYIRWLSKHGKIKEDKKSVERNYKAVAREVKSYAKQGYRFAYYRNFIHPNNIERLRTEGFHIRYEGKGQNWARWEITW
jgi:hypothetical protein